MLQPTTETSARAPLPPVYSGYADVNGIKLYHEIYGQGEPLVLLHGLFGALSNFEGLIQYFRNYNKVIVPVLPLFELDILHTTVGGLAKFVNKFFEAREQYKTFFKENPEAVLKNMVFGELNKYESYLLERKHLITSCPLKCAILIKHLLVP